MICKNPGGGNGLPPPHGTAYVCQFKSASSCLHCIEIKADHCKGRPL